ncbi:MAG: hypothetical protein ACT4P7_23865 [Gemmatimonadaceae bacterium]
MTHSTTRALGAPARLCAHAPGRVLLLACLTSAWAVACHPFKTTNQLRDELRGAKADSSWMWLPCQELRVDEFGWTLDSLDGIAFRVHGTLRRQPVTEPRQRIFQSRDKRQTLLLQMNPSLQASYASLTRLERPRRQECSISHRVASVATGRRGVTYETTVIWQDIGDGRALRATATGRTLEEVQVLRATLFTMQFPGDK